MLACDELISNGNFDATKLVLACDSLRNAIYRLIVLIERRVGKLLTSHFSGLPTGLATTPGHSGLDILHHTMLGLVGSASALAEITHAQAGSAAEGVEDYGSMASQGALQLRGLVRIWRTAICIELVVAARALSFRDCKVSAGIHSLLKLVDCAIHTQNTPADQIMAMEQFMIQSDSF